jgi:ferric-dicitrate binding protein FerR (iron transport regulator)
MNSMQKLAASPAKTAAVVLAGLLLVSVATWFMLISPKRSKASDLQSQVASTQGELIQRQQAAAEAARNARQFIQLGRALPNLIATPQVINQLSRLADESKVSLDTITPAAPTFGTGYRAVPMTVVLSGQFFDVQRFLHELRNQVNVGKGKVHATGRLFDVESVILAQAPPPQKMTATLKVDAFMFSAGGTTLPGSATTASVTASAGGAG